MSLTVIIQARMASGRLPGKVILPLDGTPGIKHSIRRAKSATIVDNIIVATTFHKRDDLVAQYAAEEEVDIYRGSEDDVLGRLYRASKKADSDAIIRLTGDNLLITPKLIDKVGNEILQNQFDYVSNKLDRTFPLGVDAEALTVSGLAEIHHGTDDPYHREHATKYYREHQEQFDIRNITVSDVYGKSIDGFSPKLRLTLDEVEDYRLVSRLYDEIDFEEILDVREAVQYIQKYDLFKINRHVDQKTL